MSRFGDTGTFTYAPGDSFSSATTLVLQANQMPQYPFEGAALTDRVTYRSKSGKAWSYQNYNLNKYTFNWALLDETCRNSLKAMWDAQPIINFKSNGTDFGTFRFAQDSWQDQEVINEFYDVNFSLEETT
jgi:hypothetical protein